MYEKRTRPKIQPLEIKPGMRITVLNAVELGHIQQASLDILEQTGIKFYSEKALKIFSEAGADVDFKNKIVRIPEDILSQYLEKAPRTFVMASRSTEELDLILDRTKVYYGTDGVAVKTVDLQTREERFSKKSDVAMMALIADYLPSVSFYWPIVSAQDVPSPTIPLHELEASFNNTAKHVHIVSCVEERIAQYCVEMATAVAGGAKEVRERPPLSLLVCTSSPLCQDGGAVEAAMVFAEAGLPVGIMAMPVMGMTAPASIAGALAVGNAEVLSVVCLLQMAFPACPVYYALSAEMMNPHTGKCLGGAFQKPLLNVGRVHLGHYNNLPVMAYYGSTASRRIDWRAGKENAIDALLLCLSGPELFPALGLLDSYTLLYPEKILFDHEIFESLRVMTEGINVDEDAIDLSEIKAVGPGGHFLSKESTRRNLRKIWKPGIVHQWSSRLKDFQDPQEAAIEEIRWILKNHVPAPLDKKLKEELKRIINVAETEMS
jgi:trimethylamine--corrinoid protein Co-methyltransferase